MSATRPPGSDPPHPPPSGPAASTLGGPGWRWRTSAHRDEIGTVWGNYGVRSQVAQLGDVLLAEPGDEMAYPEAPEAWLMRERPDPVRMRAQYEALASAYEAAGVRVHRHRPAQRPPPNHVFLCDTFFMTPEGAVLARMASLQRAGEERIVAEALARLGIPLLLTLRGAATFEGADALWLDERTVLLGIGRRTNQAAVDQIQPLLTSMGVEVRVVEVSSAVQHLLGSVNLLDEGLAAVRRDSLTPSLSAATAHLRTIQMEPNDEVLERRAMNFVTLGPRHVLMPAGCPRTRETYETAGVRCVEVDVGEYLKAEGGMACATGILRRG